MLLEEKTIYYKVDNDVYTVSQILNGKGEWVVEKQGVWDGSGSMLKLSGHIVYNRTLCKWYRLEMAVNALSKPRLIEVKGIQVGDIDWVDVDNGEI